MAFGRHRLKFSGRDGQKNEPRAQVATGAVWVVVPRDGAAVAGAGWAAWAALETMKATAVASRRRLGRMLLRDVTGSFLFVRKAAKLAESSATPHDGKSPIALDPWRARRRSPRLAIELTPPT